MRVTTRNGDVDVTPKTIKNGLAITPHLRNDGSLSNGFYRITHVQSGLMVPSNGITYKPRQAARVLGWLLEMGDWTLPQETVINGVKIEPLRALLRLEMNNWGTK